MWVFWRTRNSPRPARNFSAASASPFWKKEREGEIHHGANSYSRRRGNVTDRVGLILFVGRGRQGMHRGDRPSRKKKQARERTRATPIEESTGVVHARNAAENVTRPTLCITRIRRSGDISARVFLSTCSLSRRIYYIVRTVR